MLRSEGTGEMTETATCMIIRERHFRRLEGDAVKRPAEV